MKTATFYKQKSITMQLNANYAPFNCRDGNIYSSAHESIPHERLLDPDVHVLPEGGSQHDNDQLQKPLRRLHRCVFKNHLRTIPSNILGTLFGMIGGVGAVAQRSMTTKMVSEDNIGKAQTLSAIVEALGPMLFVPVYNKAIYVETMNIFPQAFFLPAIPILTLSIFVLL